VRHALVPVEHYVYNPLVLNKREHMMTYLIALRDICQLLQVITQVKSQRVCCSRGVRIVRSIDRVHACQRCQVEFHAIRGDMTIERLDVVS
jgi:hypothetical protein